MAANFDGTDDKLECADESSFDWERTSPMSLAAWVRKPTNTGESFLGKAQTASPQRGIAFNTEAGAGGIRSSFHLVSQAGGIDHLFVESVDYFQPHFWVHLAATYDGSETVGGVSLYANGVDMGAPNSSVDNLVGTILTDNPMRVAGHNTGGGEFWEGVVAGAFADNVELSAADVAKLASLGNFRKPPSEYLSANPELWLPMFARQGAASFDLNDYANNHDASIVGAPTVVGDPEVVLDWGGGGVTNQSFTTTTSFSHTAAAAVKGIVVLISQTTASTDRITAVTCDGFPLTRIPNGFAQDTATEPGAVYAYLLSRPLAAGAHTIAITVGAGTEAKRAWVCGVIAAGDVMVAASGRVQENATNPSVTLSTPADFSGLVFNVLYSGLPNPGDAVPTGSYTQLGGNHDFGAQIGGAFAANKEGASIACGWTAGADDVAMIGFAVGLKPEPHRFVRSDALHRSSRW